MSYARKAVGSVQSIAHGPAGTCSTLVIARLNLAINACIHHWEEPLGGMETGADYPSSANNREDPYRNSDPSAGGLVSGGSSTLNKRSRRRRYSFFEHPWINPVDLKNLAHTSDCPITAGSSMLTR